ncbi:MAG: hypothetical protein GQ559_08335 [Desulfobulbaceae bacterium]|nr:hypothetical protein [Desulfobulbaceae bacterium]
MGQPATGTLHQYRAANVGQATVWVQDTVKLEAPKENISISLKQLLWMKKLKVQAISV